MASVSGIVINRLLLALLLTVMLTTVSVRYASAQIQPINLLGVGGVVSAPGISSDGSTVVSSILYGVSGRVEAARWVNGTTTGLGFLSANPLNLSFAIAASADGSVIVGQSLDAANHGQAFRWNSGAMIGLGFLSQNSPGSLATGVSSDGNVIVGFSANVFGESQAFRWAGGTMSGLAPLNVLDSSYATGVSADGSITVGRSGFGSTEAVKWVGSTVTGLGFLDPGNPNRGSSALANSANGTSIAGWSINSENRTEATLWAGGNIIGLGFLTPSFPNRFSLANAISGDGTVIVGVSTSSSGTDAAFRWTSNLGMQPIQGILTAGGFDVSGFQLYNATGVSGDGTVIVGAGWIAHIPVNAFASLDLAGSNHGIGSLVWGGIVTNSGTTPAALTVGSDNSSATFIGTIQDGTSPTALIKVGTGTQTLTGNNTYSGATLVAAGALAGGAVNAFSTNSAFNVGSGAVLDLGGFNQAIGSLAGGGTVRSGVGAFRGGGPGATLTVGGDNTSTTFTGLILNGATVTALAKVGAGTQTLSGINTYTGATTINAGTLSVDGSIATSALTMVNSGGTLGGNGTVGNTLVNGGTLSPGNSAGTLTMQGSLVFTAASSYLVEISSSNSDRVNVKAAATLGGATVNAAFASGAVMRQYNILHAGGGLAGGFGALNTNLSSNFQTALSYDGNNVYLNVALNFATGLNANQQNVGNVLSSFFNTTGGIPIAFGALTPAGLTQASGETATGSQQTTFNAMSQFLGVLLDPFIGGRGEPFAPSSGATSFAEEGGGASAYASVRRKRTARESEAYAAVYRKASLRDSYDPRWSVWAAGFGGSQNTEGNAGLGSNDTTSRVFGMAVGADYIFSPRTMAGFALSGGGTSFGVANGGSGRSDLFQAGAFVRHKVAAAYVSAALAYGWQDITTDRTVAIASIDRLRAQFNANAFSGRLEGGYRFVAPWMGVGLTPYAAAQFTTFDLPGYAEQVLSGAHTFALAYASKSVTATRSELGFRADKSFAMRDAIVTLRGRAAWAHDYNRDRKVGATFQTLPGASFVVNGAAQASDSALAAASAELKWRNGWSAAATFEGEFSDVTRSYAGKGVARYAW